jgi:hypothetical protein
VLALKGRNHTLQHTGGLKPKSLDRFVQHHGYPLVGEFSVNTYYRYNDRPGDQVRAPEALWFGPSQVEAPFRSLLLSPLSLSPLSGLALLTHRLSPRGAGGDDCQPGGSHQARAQAGEEDEGGHGALRHQPRRAHVYVHDAQGVRGGRQACCVQAGAGGGDFGTRLDVSRLHTGSGSGAPCGSCGGSWGCCERATHPQQRTLGQAQGSVQGWRPSVPIRSSTVIVVVYS